MSPGHTLAAASLALILVFNERVADSFHPVPSNFCDKSLKNGDCFLTEDLASIAVRDSFNLYVQATQSIVEDEVEGSGYRAFLIRRLGRNLVPGYPSPDPEEIEQSEQFKTTNAVFLVGTIANGHLTLDPVPPPHVRARIGQTDLPFISIGGKTFVNGPLVTKPNRYEHCILGGIARPVAIANLGRRIVIGSRIAFDVRFTGPNTAVITPSVTFSRFPTTFIWVQSDFHHERAEPLDPVLEHCEGWR